MARNQTQGLSTTPAAASSASGAVSTDPALAVPATDTVIEPPAERDIEQIERYVLTHLTMSDVDAIQATVKLLCNLNDVTADSLRFMDKMVHDGQELDVTVVGSGQGTWLISGRLPANAKHLDFTTLDEHTPLSVPVELVSTNGEQLTYSLTLDHSPGYVKRMLKHASFSINEGG